MILRNKKQPTVFNEELFDLHANESVDRLIRILNSCRKGIIDHARMRARTIGAATYGNESYKKQSSLLGIDVLDELGDAVFYEHIVVSRELIRQE